VHRKGKISYTILFTREKYVVSFVDSSDLKFTGKIYACYMPTYLDEVTELGGVCLGTKLRCASGKILSTRNYTYLAYMQSKSCKCNLIETIALCLCNY